jgi:hypothetical protein
LITKNIKLEENEKKDNIIDSNLILKVLEENKELRKMIVEQQEVHHKQMMNIIPKVGNTNNNQKFNLNIFLNEQCKEAVNWDDFINSIKIGVSDLEKLIESNITDGITDALCNEINELGIYKRPLHCLDPKRKKICIKNENTWEYDYEKNKSKVEELNKKLQGKHIEQLKQWQYDNPNWEEDNEKKETFIKLTQKVMEDINSEKCIQEFAKQTSIPKIITIKNSDN